ncbi:MAG TPA: hypothetical protein GXZ63_03020 [Mollicutes bacterium]|nr:hypothetical protein [Mollicutes bacterium]
MVKIDDVLQTIDNNQNLSLEIKENFKDLLIIYTHNTNNIDLETINTNIASLKMEVCSKYLIKEPLKYIEQDNTMYINTSEIEKDHDYRFLLMRQLMLMQTYKNDISKQRNSNFTPIYEGYASIGANLFVGNDSSNNLYEDEIITVNLLGQIVGIESIEELFVNNNSQLLVDNLSRSGNELDDIKSLTDIMNYNAAARDNSRGKSMLKEIQLKLINMFANKNDKTAADIENFRTLLYSNNSVFENEAHKYEDINQVYKIYDEITANIQLSNSSSSKVM